MITVYDREEFLIEVNKLLPDHPICAEIGVYKGEFAAKILRILKPGELILIDPFAYGGAKYENGNFVAYSNTDDLNRTINNTCLAWNPVIFRGFSYDAERLLKDNLFDFIYHDASHLYNHIKGDLIHWFFKLRKGGLMCGHDYIEHEDFGVIQAVDEFCEEYNFEMIIFNENGGDYALKRK